MLCRVQPAEAVENVSFASTIDAVCTASLKIIKRYGTLCTINLYTKLSCSSSKLVFRGGEVDTKR